MTLTSNQTTGRRVPPGYFVQTNGVWRDLGEKRPPAQLTTCAVFVIALLRSRSDRDWSIELDFVNPDGRHCSLIVPRTGLSNYRELSDFCNAAGLFVLPRGAADFAEYLALCVGSEDLPRHRLTMKLGFNVFPDAACPDRLAFVMPGSTFLPHFEKVPEPNERLVFRSQFADTAFAAYIGSGDLEMSRGLLKMVRNDPAAIFAVCASLAGPFLELAGVDSFIVHFYGRSSTGKTTRLQLAAMVWGKPLDPQTAGNEETLVERWHGTANSLENLATKHNGIVLCIDELGGNTDEALSVYNQTSGRGKNRMTREGGIQIQRKWSLATVSTGELSLAERLEAYSGKPVKTGEAIRGLSLPMDDIPCYVDLSAEDASQHVQSIKDRVFETYGVIGPHFVQAVLDTFGTERVLRDELHEAVKIAHEDLTKVISRHIRSLDAAQIRALRRFAFIQIIGEWAANEILPFAESEIQAAVETVALAWLRAQPVLSADGQLVEQLRDWVIRHMGQMIKYADVMPGQHEVFIPTITKGIRYKRWILLTEADFAEACQGLSVRAAGNILRRLGVLQPESEDRHKRRQALPALGLPETAFYSIVVANLLPEEARADISGDDFQVGEPPVGNEEIGQPYSPNDISSIPYPKL